MSRQLNVRSDHAYRVATMLAKRLETTTTEVVVRALKELEQSTFQMPSPDELSPEQLADFDKFDAMTAELSERLGSDVTSDRDTLHDEAGLPK